jgi:gamma-glutamyltranspeptidase
VIGEVLGSHCRIALAVTVPGVVAAWHELTRRWGRRPVTAALLPAIAMAREGVPVSPGLARDLARETHRIAADAGLAEVFMPQGSLLPQGALLRQPRLGRTLELIGGSQEAFYTGDVATSLVQTLRERDSAMTAQDFADHSGTVEEPLSSDFGTETYFSSGGNTQGGFFLAGLRVLDALAAQHGDILDPLGEDAATLAMLLARLAEERDARLGDQQEHSEDQDWLLSVLASQSKTRRLAEEVLQGLPSRLGHARRKPSGDTVAVVVADADGQWVSLIQSVFHAFGAGIMDPHTGVLLHNRGASFDLRPGSAGELRPGRRPPHTLMPVLVRDSPSGRLIGAHGTMGGRAQPQIHTHLALHLARGRTALEAVSAQIEVNVPALARTALADTDLKIELLGARDDGTGHAQVVRAVMWPEAPNGQVSAASDPRADGIALTESS